MNIDDFLETEAKQDSIAKESNGEFDIDSFLENEAKIDSAQTEQSGGIIDTALSLPGIAYEGLKQGVKTGADLTMRGVQEIQDFPATQSLPIVGGLFTSDTAKDVVDWADDSTKDLRQPSGPTPEYAEWTNLEEPEDYAKFVAYSLGQGIGSSAPILASGPASFGTAFAMAVGDISQTLEEEAPELSKEQRTALALAGGLPYAAMDKIVPDKAVSKAQKRVVIDALLDQAEKNGIIKATRATAKVAKEIGKDAGTEGLTEGLQGVITDATAAVGASDSLAEAAQRIKDNFPKYYNEAMAGAVGGGGMSAGGQTIGALRNRKNRIADADPEQETVQDAEQVEDPQPNAPKPTQAEIDKQINDKIDAGDIEGAKAIAEANGIDTSIWDDGGEFDTQTDEEGNVTGFTRKEGADPTGRTETPSEGQTQEGDQSPTGRIADARARQAEAEAQKAEAEAKVAEAQANRIAGPEPQMPNVDPEKQVNISGPQTPESGTQTPGSSTNEPQAPSEPVAMPEPVAAEDLPDLSDKEYDTLGQFLRDHPLDLESEEVRQSDALKADRRYFTGGKKPLVTNKGEKRRDRHSPDELFTRLQEMNLAGVFGITSADDLVMALGDRNKLNEKVNKSDNDYLKMEEERARQMGYDPNQYQEPEAEADTEPVEDPNAKYDDELDEADIDPNDDLSDLKFAQKRSPANDRRVNATLRTQSREVSGEPDQLYRVEPETRSDRFLVALAGRLGRKIVFFKSRNGESATPGFVSPGAEDVIYIAKDVYDSHQQVQAVLLHEMLHSLKNSDPELYEKLMSRIRAKSKQALQENQGQYVAGALQAGQTDYAQEVLSDPDVLEEEGAAYMLEGGFLDMDMLRDADPSMFGRLKRAVRNLLARVRGQQQSPVREQAVDALRGYLEVIDEAEAQAIEQDRVIEPEAPPVATTPNEDEPDEDGVDSEQENNDDGAPSTDKGDSAPSSLGDGNIRYSFKRDLAPTTYSALTQTISSNMPNAMPPQDAKNWVSKQQGIKEEELEFTGLLDWLDTQEGKVSKDDVLEYLEENQVNVEVVEKGATENRINWGDIEESEDLREVTGVDAQGKKYRIVEEFGNGAYIQEETSPNVFTDIGDDLYDDIEHAIEVYNQNLGELAGRDATKFQSYTLPGAKEGSYREMLLTWPEKETNEPLDPNFIEPTQQDGERLAELYWQRRWAETGFNDAQPLTPAEETEYQELNTRFDEMKRRQKSNDSKKEGRYKSSHFDEPNILAHLRFNERVDANGDRVMFLEEVQSDWATSFRKDADNTPNAPFIKDPNKWPELALKHALRYAAENDLDKIAWTTGEQQVKRYEDSTRQAVDKIEVDYLQGSTQPYKITGYKDGVELTPHYTTEGELSKLIGRKMAEEAIANLDAQRNDKTFLNDVIEAAVEGGMTREQAKADVEHLFIEPLDTNERPTLEQWKRLGDATEESGLELNDYFHREYSKITEPAVFEGENLTIGGEGMKGFYNKILPNIAKKVVKKLDKKHPGVEKINWQSNNQVYRLLDDNGNFVDESYSEEEIEQIQKMRTFGEFRPTFNEEAEFYQEEDGTWTGELPIIALETSGHPNREVAEQALLEEWWEGLDPDGYFGTIEKPTPTDQQLAIQITPTLKEKVLYEGQTRFAMGRMKPIKRNEYGGALPDPENIFKNPRRRDVFKQIKANPYRTLRGILTNDGDLYFTDADRYTHEDMYDAAEIEGGGINFLIYKDDDDELGLSVWSDRKGQFTEKVLNALSQFGMKPKKIDGTGNRDYDLEQQRLYGPTVADLHSGRFAQKRDRSLPESLEASGRNAGDDLQYEPVSNQGDIDYAKQRLLDGPGKAYDELLDTESKDYSSKDFATTILLLDQWQQEADLARSEGNTAAEEDAMAKVLRLSAHASQQLTNAGQVVQSASILSRLDPGAVVLQAQRVVDKINEKRGDKEPDIQLDAKVITELKEAAARARDWDYITKDGKRIAQIVTKINTRTPLNQKDKAALVNFVKRTRKILNGAFPDAVPSTPQPAQEAPKKKRSKYADVELTGWKALVDEKLKSKEDAARERLRKRGIKIGAGIPADIMADLVIIGTTKALRTGLNFTEWSQEMIADIGDDFKDGLRDVYAKVKRELNVEEKRAKRIESQIAKFEGLLEEELEEMESMRLIGTEHYQALSDAIDFIKTSSGDAKIEAAQEVQHTLNMLAPATFGDKMSTAQAISHLLNTKTNVRNILGNELFYRLERLRKYVATFADVVGSSITGNDRSVTYARGGQGGYIEALKKGVILGWKGISPADLTTQFDLNPKGPVFRDPRNPLHWMEKALGATLRGFDYAAYSRGKNNVLGEMAELAWINQKKTGDAKQKQKFINDYIENADNEIVNIAHEYGKYLTFQEDSALAELFTTAKRGLNVIGVGGERVSRGQRVGGFGMGDLVLKYAKTPANLIQTALDYSPVGIVHSMAMLSGAAFKGNHTQREVVEALSRGLVGTLGTSLVGAMLYDLGLLTGDEDDWAKDAFLRDQGGMSSFQVNLSGLARYLTTWRRDAAKPRPGDTLYTYDWMQPMAINFSIGTSVMESVNESANKGEASMDAFEAGVDALGAGMDTIIEQPLLQGLLELMPSKWGNEGVMDRVGRIVEGMPAQIVPSFVNHIRSISDNTRNITSDPKSYQRAFNRMIDRIPFLQDTLPDAYKTFGIDQKAVKYENGTNVLSNAFEVLLNPGFARTYGVQPEAAQILGIYEASGDDKVMQDRNTNKITVGTNALNDLPGVRSGRISRFTGNTKVQLTKEDRSKLQALIGRYSFEEFKDVEPYLRDMTAEEQAEAVADAMKAGYDRAKEWWLENRLPEYYK